MHLAAQVDVRQSIADPALDAQINVAGTVSVLEAAREAGARRVRAWPPPAAVYGDPRDSRPRDRADRAALAVRTSKAAAEWYLGQYQRLHGISTLRAADGERVRAAAGSARRGRRDLDLLRRRADGRPRDGVRQRAPDARLRLHRRRRRAPGWRPRRATSPARSTCRPGVETSVLDVADALDLAYDFAPGRPGEIERSCLDPSAAAAQLGWAARVPLARGAAPDARRDARPRARLQRHGTGS